MQAMKQKGFTLIEILVVITIIGILATLVAPKVLGRADDAKVTKARSDVQAYIAALKLYRLDNGVYPSTEQGLKALVEKPTVGQIPNNWKANMDSQRKDPWDRDYLYLNPGLHGEVDVMSYGADGQAGGEGYNADIGSWMQ